MRRYRAVLVISGLVVIVMAAVARPAGAGTIGLDGTVTFPGPVGEGRLNLGGTRGFTATGFVPRLPSPCAPCRPGDALGVSFFASTEDIFSGIMTLEGVTYNVGGQIVSGLEPQFRLTATGPLLFAPPLNVAPSVALITPVDITGTFMHQGIIETLEAIATATLVLTHSDGGPEFGDLWITSSTTYDLTATPEPTTLLLFGTTMAGLGFTARWRQRRRGKQHA